MNDIDRAIAARCETPIDIGGESVPRWVVEYADALTTYHAERGGGSWAIGGVQSRDHAPPAAAVPDGYALNYVAGLLKLSDHHLTNGPHPIERGETYWKAQAAVAIGGVNECAMLAAAERKGE